VYGVGVVEALLVSAFLIVEGGSIWGSWGVFFSGLGILFTIGVFASMVHHACCCDGTVLVLSRGIDVPSGADGDEARFPGEGKRLAA
jgi:hypothetical protein